MRLKGVLIVTAAVAACSSFPGMRPEGRVLSVTASAPASRDSVFRRAADWIRTQGYTITSERMNDRVVGYTLMSRDGTVETRSELTFTINGSSGTETSFTTRARTLRGVPPAMSEIDAESSPAFRDMETLRSRLTCPGARWPTCP